MIIDIHSHMINPNFNLEKVKSNFTTRMFFLRLKTIKFSQYSENFSSSLKESKVYKTVLVALEVIWS